MLFHPLLRLYANTRNPNKTPLEDFTTEILCGLLNLFDDIKISFTTNFLNLPEAKYTLRTQVKYALTDDIDCVVDYVFENNNTICFIENKVNSREGIRQLERYSKVLDRFSEQGKNTYLIYCTKLYDIKNIKGHNFRNIRWFEIAAFLYNKFNDNRLITEFISFLKKHDMAQELIFNPTDYLIVSNMQNTISKFKEYLERAKPFFENTFISSSNLINGCTIKQVLDHNRLIYYYKDILPTSGWSEIKYGFMFDKPIAYTGIWIDRKNSQFPEYLEKINSYKENEKYSIGELTSGAFFEFKKDISIYLNDEKAEVDITRWFKEAFILLSEFIQSTQGIKWKIQIR